MAFVHDAFAHLKVIGATAGAKSLLDKAGVIPDKGVISAADATVVEAFLTQAAQGRIWEREPKVRTTY